MKTGLLGKTTMRKGIRNCFTEPLQAAATRFMLRSCWCHFWIWHDLAEYVSMQSWACSWASEHFDPPWFAKSPCKSRCCSTGTLSTSDISFRAAPLWHHYPPKISKDCSILGCYHCYLTCPHLQRPPTTEPVTNMALAESARSFLISDTLGPAPCRTSERWHKWPATPLTCMGWALGHYLSSFLADFHRGRQHIIQKLQSKTAVNPSHHWSSTEEQKVKLTPSPGGDCVYHMSINYRVKLYPSFYTSPSPPKKTMPVDIVDMTFSSNMYRWLPQTIAFPCFSHV